MKMVNSLFVGRKAVMQILRFTERLSGERRNMDEYQVSDLALCGYLLLLRDKGEIKFVRSDVGERGHVTLVFTPYKKCNDLINEFYTDTTPLVSPLKFSKAMKEAKDMIFYLKDRKA